MDSKLPIDWSNSTHSDRSFAVELAIRDQFAKYDDRLSSVVAWRRPREFFRITTTPLPDINSFKPVELEPLYPEHRLRYCGYMPAHRKKELVDKDPLKHRSKFMCNAIHIHQEWDFRILLATEYATKCISDKSRWNSDRYMLKHYVFAIPYLFNRDNIQMEVLDGYKYTAPPMVYTYCSEELQREIMENTKAYDCKVSRQDHCWKLMDVDTKYFYVSHRQWLWLWMNRQLLSAKGCAFIEDDPHFLLPDILLPRDDQAYSANSYEVLSSLATPVDVSECNDEEESKEEAVKVFSGKDFTTDAGSSTSAAFIGIENGMTTQGKVMLPYYVSKFGTENVQGFYTRRVVATAKILKVGNKAKKVSFYDDIPENLDTACPTHIARFRELGSEMYDDVIPLYKIWHTTLPQILRPASERILPITPRNGDPFYRRWTTEFNSKHESAFWTADVPTSLLPSTGKKAEPKVDGTHVVKSMPANMINHINLMDLRWRYRIINALERVSTRASGQYVWRYICATLDEYERLVQLVARNKYIISQFYTVCAEIGDVSGVKPLEELLAFTSRFPLPPFMPRMHHESESVCKIASVEI